MTESIAILRLCRCCVRMRSIDCFAPLGLLCRACMYSDQPKKGGRPSGRKALSRGMQITPKGRAWLETERHAA